MESKGAVEAHLHLSKIVSNITILRQDYESHVVYTNLQGIMAKFWTSTQGKYEEFRTNASKKIQSSSETTL